MEGATHFIRVFRVTKETIANNNIIPIVKEGDVLNTMVQHLQDLFQDEVYARNAKVQTLFIWKIKPKNKQQ